STAGTSLNTFVVKFNSNGNCAWQDQLSNVDNLPYGIAVDSADKVYVTGAFSAGTLYVDESLFFIITSLSASNVSNFVVKLDSSSNLAVWSKKVTSPNDIINGLGTKHDIAVDSQGNVYTTSDFQGTADFGNGAVLTTGEDFNVYVSKRDANGNLIW